MRLVGGAAVFIYKCAHEFVLDFRIHSAEVDGPSALDGSVVGIGAAQNVVGLDRLAPTASSAAAVVNWQFYGQISWPKLPRQVLQHRRGAREAVRVGGAVRDIEFGAGEWVVGCCWGRWEGCFAF